MSLHIAEVEVIDDYEAKNPYQLTISRGDIIKNCKPLYDGEAMEGELNGKQGSFPVTNVVVTKVYNPPPLPPLPGVLYILVCRCTYALCVCFVCMCEHNYNNYLHVCSVVLVLQTHFGLVFKPGACRPQASAHLVS